MADEELSQANSDHQATSGHQATPEHQTASETTPNNNDTPDNQVSSDQNVSDHPLATRNHESTPNHKDTSADNQVTPDHSGSAIHQANPDTHTIPNHKSSYGSGPVTRRRTSSSGHRADTPVIQSHGTSWTRSKRQLLLTLILFGFLCLILTIIILFWIIRDVLLQQAAADPQYADIVLPGDPDWHDNLQATYSGDHVDESEFVADLQRSYPFLSKSCGLPFRRVILPGNNHSDDAQVDQQQRIEDLESEKAKERVLYYGSYPAKLGEYPWHLHLSTIITLQNMTGVFIYHCAATLISSQYALTAAHCYLPNRTLFGWATPGLLLQSQLDEVIRQSEEDYHSNTRPLSHPLAFRITDNQTYPGFNPENSTSGIDMAILRLERPVPRLYLRNHSPGMIVATPICLPSLALFDRHNLTLEDTDMWLAGSGEVGDERHGVVVQDRLRVAQLYYNTDTECEPLNETSINSQSERTPSYLTFCGDRLHPRRAAACEGDSGGGLMTDGWDPVRPYTRFLQAGVVSQGQAVIDELIRSPDYAEIVRQNMTHILYDTLPCNDFSVGLFTSVLAQEDWIRQTVQEMAARNRDEFKDIY